MLGLTPPSVLFVFWVSSSFPVAASLVFSIQTLPHNSDQWLCFCAFLFSTNNISCHLKLLFVSPQKYGRTAWHLVLFVGFVFGRTVGGRGGLEDLGDRSTDRSWQHFEKRSHRKGCKVSLVSLLPKGNQGPSCKALHAHQRLHFDTH